MTVPHDNPEPPGSEPPADPGYHNLHEPEDHLAGESYEEYIQKKKEELLQQIEELKTTAAAKPRR